MPNPNSKGTNYRKASLSGFSSNLLRDNPIVTDPSRLINRKILDIGERLLDFIPKIAKHLSISNAKKIEDPTYRLMKYAITDNNKIHSIILLIYDKTTKEKRNYCTFVKEELGAAWAQSTTNLLTFGWDSGTSNILKIAELLVYMGALELCDNKENINE